MKILGPSVRKWGDHPILSLLHVCVCVSGPLIATILSWFLWNLDHMILTKIWDYTFLRFWKCCSNDVITSILRFFYAAPSCLPFFYNFRPIFMKLGPHHLSKNLRWHFSQILKILLQWRHNGYFEFFSVRHFHAFNFCAISPKLTHSNLQLNALYGIANQQFRLISSNQYGRRKNRKTR